jgi:hypothetical protein
MREIHDKHCDMMTEVLCGIVDTIERETGSEVLITWGIKSKGKGINYGVVSSNNLKFDTASVASTLNAQKTVELFEKK